MPEEKTTLPVILSVVVPCYNEEVWLKESITRFHHVFSGAGAVEIIIVDDGSRDNSRKVAEQLMQELPGIVLCSHDQNQGKGAALRTGFARASGEYIAVHDADLEYNPADLLRMLNYMREHKVDVVFGTRFLPQTVRRALYFWHTIANKVITLWCNMFTNLNLTDIECCYKMFTREVLSRITIDEDGFGVEPELVSKCARMRLGKAKLIMCEIGVDYHGRTYSEGKKIGVKDAFYALWVVLKYSVFR